MNNASQLRYQTRPEIYFRANSESPLKWTKQLFSFLPRPEMNFRANRESPLKLTKQLFSVLLRGLQLLARDFNPWRVELLARSLKSREFRSKKYEF